MLDKLISIFKKPKASSMLGMASGQRLIAAGWSGLRPYWNTHTQSMAKEVSVGEWKRIVSASNKAFWNFGPIQGAIEEKAMYAVGKSWQPRHVGGKGDQRVREWGDMAEEWLVNQFYPVAYINGMDFVTGLYLDSVAIDRDGDSFCLYTESRDGYPQFQALPWHKIGSRENGTTLESGPYKGLKVYNGIVLSAGGRLRLKSQTMTAERVSLCRRVRLTTSASHGRLIRCADFLPSPRRCSTFET